MQHEFVSDEEEMRVQLINDQKENKFVDKELELEEISPKG